MRYAVALSASLPQAIIDLPWSADTLTVTNSTSAVLYVRVGGRDYPSATNFDHDVPARSSRTLPVVGGSFALSLYAGPVGALGGVIGFSARCDCLFLKSETPPSMAGYQLPAVTQAWVSDGDSETIIDARGFDSIWLSMERAMPAPSETWWVISESASPSGPWARVTSYLQLFGVGDGRLRRIIPVGAGYIKVAVASSAPAANSGLSYRLRNGPADNALVRSFRTIATTTWAALAAGDTQVLLDYFTYSGRVVALAVKLSGLNSSAEPCVELDIYPDIDYATYFTPLVVGRVSTYPPLYSPYALEVAAAAPWLMDGDATSRYWYIPVDIASNAHLRVDVTNLSTLGGGVYTLPSLRVAAVLDVEV